MGLTLPVDPARRATQRYPRLGQTCLPSLILSDWRLCSRPWLPAHLIPRRRMGLRYRLQFILEQVDQRKHSEVDFYEPVH
jgi:hypothetical protein